jgi:hypothetical protein
MKVGNIPIAINTARRVEISFRFVLLLSIYILPFCHTLYVLFACFHDLLVSLASLYAPFCKQKAQQTPKLSKKLCVTLDFGFSVCPTIVLLDWQVCLLAALP